MFLLFLSSPAEAGMGAVTWSDVPTYLTLSSFTRARLEALSFFLVGVLTCAALVQGLWNYLGRDFARLPRLSYFKGLALVGLWGLLSVLVLTMISGARELMTPGAWEKKGLFYHLAQEEMPADTLNVERYQGLERLRAALWQYAAANDGRFPATREGGGIPQDVWQVPDPSAMPYVYVGGLTADRSAKPLAYEPAVFGSQRLLLSANGEIEHTGIEDIQHRLGRRNP
jgi:hypothetical protein